MREEGWEERLVAAIESARHEPYALGKHDCFRMACLVIEALTFENRWPEFAGKYSDRRGALRLIAQHGSTFGEAFDWFFRVNSTSPRKARRGDILEHSDAKGESHLVVCLGVNAAALTPEGLGFVKTLACRRAWSIG